MSDHVAQPAGAGQGFDDNDRLVSHSDDAGNQTTWAYDALDRATTMTYPDASDVDYTHDLEDRVTQTIDPAGSTIADTYDALGRRTGRTVTRGSGVLDTTTESFSYDGVDRLITAEDDDYDVGFSYGVLGLSSNVYQEFQQYGTGTAHLRTVTRKYDAVGNKTSEVYPSTLALTYAYTDVNLVSSVTNGANPVATYAYSGLRRKQLTLGNGSKTMFSYSGFRGEVASIDHQDHIGNSLLRLDYAYNKVHDRTYERYGAGGQPGDAFEYDPARRLTVAYMGSANPASPSGSAYVHKINYGMDDDGNRTAVAVTPWGSSPVNTSYTDNSLNQYTVVGGVNRSHDGNGNVSDDGTYLYEYNYKNLICRVKLKSNNSIVAEYKYDALGRRVEKSITGATYRYIYSGVETVSVYTSTGTWKQNYVYGPGIDEVLMLEQADVLDWNANANTAELARSWYRSNALGSIMRVEEPDKTEAVSYRYDPYGEVTISRGGTPQGSDPLGQYVTYAGRWRDEEVGLYYYRARTYDPDQGRFLQRDPLSYDRGGEQYEAMRCSPATNIDPLGFESSLTDVRMKLKDALKDPEVARLWQELKDCAEQKRRGAACLLENALDLANALLEVDSALDDAVALCPCGSVVHTMNGGIGYVRWIGLWSPPPPTTVSQVEQIGENCSSKLCDSRSATGTTTLVLGVGLAWKGLMPRIVFDATLKITMTSTWTLYDEALAPPTDPPVPPPTRGGPCGPCTPTAPGQMYGSDLPTVTVPLSNVPGGGLPPPIVRRLGPNPRSELP